MGPVFNMAKDDEDVSDVDEEISDDDLVTEKRNLGEEMDLIQSLHRKYRRAKEC